MPYNYISAHWDIFPGKPNRIAVNIRPYNIRPGIIHFEDVSVQFTDHPCWY